MRTAKDNSQAARCFTQVIQIDERDGGAWGNLGCILLKQGNKDSALNAFSKGVQYSEGNWKMWENLMLVSLERKQFTTFLRAVEALNKLGCHNRLTNEVLSKVNLVYEFTLQEFRKKHRMSAIYFKQITRIFKSLELKKSNNPNYWNIFSRFFQL